MKHFTGFLFVGIIVFIAVYLIACSPSGSAKWLKDSKGNSHRQTLVVKYPKLAYTDCTQVRIMLLGPGSQPDTTFIANDIFLRRKKQ